MKRLKPGQVSRWGSRKHNTDRSLDQCIKTTISSNNTKLQPGNTINSTIPTENTYQRPG